MSNGENIPKLSEQDARFFMQPNGQIALDVELGRDVPTAREVLDVIRPQMRAMRYIYRGQIDAAREGWLDADEDLEIRDGGDNHVEYVIFQSLWDDAMSSVTDWARDMGKVFDKSRVYELIRLALTNAMVTKDGIEMLHEGALDY